MPVAILFELRAVAGNAEKLFDFVTSLIPETRAYPGCVQIDAYVDQEDPLRIVCVEKWESREAYDRYIAWRTETGVIGGALAFCDGPPTLRTLLEPEA